MSSNVLSADQLSTADLTFHPFPRLTSELRLRIWRLVLNSRRSRLVAVKVVNSSERGQILDGNRWQTGSLRYNEELIGKQDLVCTIKAPTILHVNKEVRYEGLKIYNCQFKGQPFSPTNFDFDSGVMFFTSEAALITFEGKDNTTKDKSRVKFVMLLVTTRITVNGRCENYSRVTFTTLSQFPGLEHLILEGYDYFKKHYSASGWPLRNSIYVAHCITGSWEIKPGHFRRALTLRLMDKGKIELLEGQEFVDIDELGEKG